MKKQEKWIVVANSSSARIFKLETLTKLTEIKTFVHPESRLHERDLVSSKPGESFESFGTGRHPIEPPTSQKDTEFALFAKMLNEYLVKEHVDAKFSELYLVASPNFLGLLRQTLSPTLLHLVTKEVNKDIVRASTSEILQHLSL